MHWKELFPYKPYLPQAEFMDDVSRVFETKSMLVAEACNGFGKTSCSLSAALSLNCKIIYATRTHEQASQVLNEVKAINKYSTHDYSAVILAGREHLCLNRKCKGLLAAEAAEVCKLLRAKEKCQYYWKLEEYPKVIPKSLSVSVLQKLGNKEKFCPYFMARKASENFDVIVAPYQYVFNKVVREKVKLELEGKILIFDEAHNADNIGLSALSDRLYERSTENAKKELSHINMNFDFLDRLTDYIESANSIVKSGTDFNRDLNTLLGFENSSKTEISLFLEQFPNMVDKIREYKLEMGQSPSCYLNAVLSFLSLVIFNPPQCFVTVLRTSKMGYKYVEYRCLDPALAINPVLKIAAGALIMSGTLSPLKIFAKVIGVEHVEVKAYRSIANPENITTTIDTTVSTKFNKRNDEMILQYGKKILDYLDSVTKGALIFFPQRKLLDHALKLWVDKKIIQQKNKKYIFAKKRLFIEGRNAEENRNILNEYRKTTKRKGAVLLSVFRGRNAEGTNFPDDYGKAIFLVGVPYADYSDPVVQAQINYFNNKTKGLGQEWYTMDAFRTANQALGRGIRHKDDSCKYFLMDTRYNYNIRMIAHWITSNNLSIKK